MICKFGFTQSYWANLFSFKNNNISSVGVFCYATGKAMPSDPIKLELDDGNFSDRHNYFMLKESKRG